MRAGSLAADGQRANESSVSESVSGSHGKSLVNIVVASVCACVRLPVRSFVVGGSVFRPGWLPAGRPVARSLARPTGE